MTQGMKAVDIDKLKETLRPWIREETWHTGHPADEKRFNKAIRDSLFGRRKSIDVGLFRNAMNQLVEELHPGFDKEEQDSLVHSYSLRAAHIESYLHDKKGL